MAASANPSGNGQDQGQRQGRSNNHGRSNNQQNSNGKSGTTQVGTDTAAAIAAKLKHNPGIETDWSVEEQAILEDGIKRYAAESNIVRYAKIAMQLPKKTVRDVALRCRWMNKKEISKRRKDENSRKSKDKREKVTDPAPKSSQPASRPAPHSYSFQTVSLDSDDDISYSAISGPVGELLEQNAQAFEQIAANFSSHQIQENITLLCQARDNITKILSSLSEMPEVMKQMPPLPVKLNEELANSILPQRQF